VGGLAGALYGSANSTERRRALWSSGGRGGVDEHPIACLQSAGAWRLLPQTIDGTRALDRSVRTSGALPGPAEPWRDPSRTWRPALNEEDRCPKRPSPSLWRLSWTRSSPSTPQRTRRVASSTASRPKTGSSTGLGSVWRTMTGSYRTPTRSSRLLPCRRASSPVRRSSRATRATSP
jgi:hypothetical protein